MEDIGISKSTLILTGLLGVGFQRFGSEDRLSVDPIQHLFEVYVRVNQEAQSEPGIYREAQRFSQAMEEGR